MEFVKFSNKNRDIFKQTYIDAFRQGFVGFTPNNFIDSFSDDFESYLNEIKSLEKYICYENQVPIGVIVFGKSQIEDSSLLDAEIDAIYILEKYHKKGYGTAALNFAFNSLKNQGFKKVLLWCSKENERAWNFYQKNGFIPTDKKWDDTLDGKVFHNILFKRNLV